MKNVLITGNVAMFVLFVSVAVSVIKDYRQMNKNLKQLGLQKI